jgi:hypothetical protein
MLYVELERGKAEKGAAPDKRLKAGAGPGVLHEKIYIEVLKEAKVGSATMKDTTPAMTQRTNRAIVSFTAE